MTRSSKSIEAALSAEISKAVARNDVPAHADAVPAIVQAVAPIAINARNAEPWYQSRVIWGVIISSAATVAKLVLPDLDLSDGDVQAVAEAATTIAQGLGMLLTLYGRLRPNKPLSLFGRRS